jgi:N-acetylmuramoyl-L-alanine amidase
MRFFVVFVLIFVATGCARHVPLPRVDPAREREIAFEEALKKRRQHIRIVVDAGHGGDDFGCSTHSEPKLKEKDLALTVAKFLDRYLKKQGYSTLMTRSDDTFIPLKKRAELANDYKADVFVSVHFNSAPAKKAEVIEVYYYKGEKTPDRTDKSIELGTKVLDELILETSAKSRGVRHGNFAVVRETKMAAILVEAGFLTNDQEAERIRKVGYLQGLAKACAKGVHAYLQDKRDVLVAQ